MANQNLKLALQITADLNQAKSEIAGLNQSLDKTRALANDAKISSNLTTSAKQAAAAIKEIDVAADLSTGVKQFDDYNSIVAEAAKILENTSDKANTLNESADAVLPSLAKLAAAVGGLQLGISLIDGIDDWGQYDDRIKMATKSEAEYTLVKQRLLETANNTYRPLQEAQELYIRTSSSIKDLGYNTAQSLDITDSFSYLLVTNAASADKAQSALDAFSKSIVKNKVEADAWESIVTAMPTLVAAIATATGKTEAEIRGLGANGKLALNDLTEGFRITRDANLELAKGMDATRKDAVNKLKNDFFSLLGEFNKTYQVTQALSGGIGVLADNMELVTGATAVLIAGALTKYLVTAAIAARQNATALYYQLTATGAAATAERVRAAALLTLANAQVATTGTALANAETTLAAAVANTSGTVTAAQLAAAEVVVAEARIADVAATRAQTIAQTANTAANRAGILTAVGLRAVLFGPTGLALIVAGVAASFFLMRDSSETASTALDAQGFSVEELTKKYKALNAEQRQAEGASLRENLKEQSTALYKANQKLGEFNLDGIFNVKKLLLYNEALGKIKNEGADTNKIFIQLKNTDLFSENDLDQISKASKEYNEAKNVVQKTQQQLDILTGKTIVASTAGNGLTQSLNNQGIAANKTATGLKTVNKELQDYIDKSKQGIISNTFQANLMNKGYSQAQSKALYDAYQAKQTMLDPKDRRVNNADVKIALATVKAEEDLALVTDKRKQDEENITKEKEKQKKIAEQTNRLVGLVGSTGTSTGNHLDIRYDQSFSSGAVSAEHLARFQLGGKKLDAKNSNSPYGSRIHPVTGKKSLHRGYDFAAPAGTEVTTDYPIKDVVTFFDKKGGGYVSKVIFEDGVVVNLLHQLPKMKNAIRSGSSKGKDSSALSNDRYDLFVNQQQEQEKLQEEQLNIKKELFTETEKLTFEHENRLERIRKAGFSAVDRDALIAKENVNFALNSDPKLAEALKRIKDATSGLQVDLLKAQGNDLEAQLLSIEEKYQQLKADLGMAAEKTTDPVAKQQYLQYQANVDIIINKEKLIAQLNSAMQKLQDVQSLRSVRLDNLKVQFDSGQISQSQYAEQARAIDNELKPRLQELVELATQYAEKIGGAEGAKAVENINAIGASLSNANNDFKKFLPTADQLNDRIAGGLTDAIMAFADGTKSAGDAFRAFASSFLLEIAQMILKQMIFNAIGGASAGGGLGGIIAGGISAAFGGGFSSGGYTGQGSKYQAAGIVHRDEYVIRKESTSQPGAKSFLSYFNQHGMDALKHFKGYADGGLVGSNMRPSIISPQKLADPAAQIAASTSFSANQNFLLVDDPARLTDYLKSGAGQETLVVMMSRDPAKFKSALKIGG